MTLLAIDDIKQAINRAVSVAHAPRKAILFGSYARAQAHAASDLDILLVEDVVPDPVAEYSRVREAIGTVGTGVDILIYTAAEFERRKNWWSSPVYWAVREGQVIYER